MREAIRLDPYVSRLGVLHLSPSDPVRYPVRQSLQSDQGTAILQGEERLKLGTTARLLSDGTQAAHRSCSGFVNVADEEENRSA